MNPVLTKYVWLQKGPNQLVVVQIDDVFYRTDQPGELIEVHPEEEGWVVKNSFVAATYPDAGEGGDSATRRWEIYQAAIKALGGGEMFLEDMDELDGRAIVSAEHSQGFHDQLSARLRTDEDLARVFVNIRVDMICRHRAPEGREYREDMLATRDHVRFLLYVWLRGKGFLEADQIFPRSKDTFDWWKIDTERDLKRSGVMRERESLD